MSGRRDSNPRPSAWKANALSTELLPQICGGQGWIRTTEGVSQQIYSLPHLATLVLAQQYFKKSGRRGSNPRPSAWKANALSTELLPQFLVGKDGFEPPKSKDSRFTVCPIWPLWYLPVRNQDLVLFSIAMQRYDYFFNLQIKSIIFIAVIAHSSPLFPNFPPARSSACCMLLVVMRP